MRTGAIESTFIRDPVTRFWSRVTKTHGCWVWTGSKTHGYGQVYFAGRQQQSHRVGYALVRGPIPAGMELDHLCRNRACVRPDHLEPVPTSENLRRGYGASGINGRKTHCVNGHEFTPDNTRQTAGGRRCRACAHALSAARAADAKAARAVQVKSAECGVCGLVFVYSGRTRKLCSPECVRIAGRVRSARHRAARG